jgi:hypothetical protein
MNGRQRDSNGSKPAKSGQKADRARIEESPFHTGSLRPQIKQGIETKLRFHSR